MKKKLAIAIILALILGLFSGCSQSEIGYFKLNNDIQDNSYEVKGNVDLTYNKKAVNDYFTKFLKDTYGEYYEEEDNPFNEINFDGTITLNYNGKISYNKMYADLKLELNIENSTIDLGRIIIDSDDGLYVTKDSIIGLLKVAKILDTNEEGQMYTQRVENELNELLKEDSYINIYEGYEDYELVHFNSLSNKNLLKDKEMEFFKSAFKNYSSGLITDYSKGYKLSATLQQIGDTLVETLDYILNNEDDFFESLKIYKDNLNTEIDNENINNYIKDILSELEENKIEFRNNLIMFKDGIEMGMESDMFSDFKNSSFNSEINSTKNGFEITTTLNIVAEGKTLFNISENATIIPKEINNETPKTSSISIEEIEKKLNEINNEIRPVISAEITLDSYDDTAWIDYYRSGNGAFWCSDLDDYDYLDYKYKNGRILLPVRNICESFGEEVKWDKKNKKAYIKKDGKDIYLDGIFDNDTYFIKIRELEKLNYKVEYEKEEDFEIINITK
ncbi:stalk domain-containing protein [Anaerovorax odorimutans]|uniref:stalk domain-containing protein n=1 Tax=Anaerovorax odorimutans TaxID=109327 RepID=UPI00041F6A54|nr:stalk domain-containing protein [Anaerovorax odorimutans]